MNRPRHTLAARQLSPLAIAALLFTPGCAQSPFDARSEKLIRTEIYLGLSSPKGDVSDRELADFLADVVTPRFPDGYTLIPTTGYYRPAGKTSTAKEPGLILLILRPPTRATDDAVEAIRREYKLRFDQESTLRADAPVRADFQ